MNNWMNYLFSKELPIFHSMNNLFFERTTIVLWKNKLFIGSSPEHCWQRVPPRPGRTTGRKTIRGQTTIVWHHLYILEIALEKIRFQYQKFLRVQSLWVILSISFSRMFTLFISKQTNTCKKRERKLASLWHFHPKVHSHIKTL